MKLYLGNNEMLTAFIPAKGTSKRIARKNMTQLGGKPLIAWTLDICKKFDKIKKVFVATEDDEIAEYAQTYAQVDIWPLEENDVLDQRTVSHLWQEFCKFSNGIQILFHITNPFRKLSELECAVDMYNTGKYDVVRSVREERHLILDCAGKPTISWEERMSRLTQHVKPNYISDGSFYVADAEYIRTCKYFEQGNVGLVPVSKISGIEIDTFEDLELARIVAQSFCPNLKANATI